jgi:hypothetical protein
MASDDKNSAFCGWGPRRTTRSNCRSIIFAFSIVSMFDLLLVAVVAFLLFWSVHAPCFHNAEAILGRLLGVISYDPPGTSLSTFRGVSDLRPERAAPARSSDGGGTWRRQESTTDESFLMPSRAASDCDPNWIRNQGSVKKSPMKFWRVREEMK